MSKDGEENMSGDVVDSAGLTVAQAAKIRDHVAVGCQKDVAGLTYKGRQSFECLLDMPYMGTILDIVWAKSWQGF